MKRGYKLQEFVAHNSNVNCLRIGKKSSRVVVTGGEDHKVNLWAIGKPNSILSLSGHTSPVESLTFDSSEVLVVAGASSGTIKLWDLEEAKVVRTLTGHRSNCISVDFHPFGEFFASGSLDTNLKIWDMRRKGCIHTYKGHNRGVSAIKFTPDGRWLVSGGEDHVIKLWDLTAGKLLHDFKSHEGQIQCIDFHPHEFLLATGSSDRTVKFWDLETFELIGSAGPETTGVRSMVFNPDGRTLFCGLHESLKVFSWEPVRCHDTVDMGWSKLADLNVHEGKLLGCSFNQSCVGVWVADISRIAPYAIGGMPRNLPVEPKPNTREGQPLQQLDSSMKSSRKSVSPPLSLETKEVKINHPAVNSSETVPRTPQRVGLMSSSKPFASNSTTTSNTSSLKKNATPKVQPVINTQAVVRQEVIPVIVPRINQKLEPPTDLKTDSAPVERMGLASKSLHVRKGSINAGGISGESVSNRPGSSSGKNNALNCEVEKNFFPELDTKDAGSRFDEGNATIIKEISAKTESSLTVGTAPINRLEGDSKLIFANRRTRTVENLKERKPSIGRTRTSVDNWERMERSPNNDIRCTSVSESPDRSVTNIRGISVVPESPDCSFSIMKNGLPPASSEDDYESGLKDHNLFSTDIQSRLTKLQVVRRFWGRNDIKGAIFTVEKMSDHSVQADVMSVLVERIDIVTLEICACVLPILTGLLDSKFDRHINVSLEMLLKLVRTFGPMIHSTVSGPALVGVDLHAEERLERCNQCFVELQKIKQCVGSLLWKGGLTSRAANELNLAIQEVGCC